MRKKKALRIDLDDICSALEDNSCEDNYYLDLKTGEILLVSGWTDEREAEKLRGKLINIPNAITLAQG
jgi:hypothetical protein